jgi:hypothetical protein
MMSDADQLPGTHPPNGTETILIEVTEPENWIATVSEKLLHAHETGQHTDAMR